MAVDFFLKLDGIQGESQDDKHKNEIEVLSFSFGMTNAASSALGGGGGSGKVLVHDVVVIKHVDKSSPKVWEACNSGKHISSAILYCRKQGGSQQEYFKITMSDVLVSGHDTMSGAPIGRRQWDPVRNASGGTPAAAASVAPAVPIPTEHVRFNFSKIEWEYKEQDSKGNSMGPVKAGWDLKANKKV
jgi:type VI secretion system secreted protein Hcp